MGYGITRKPRNMGQAVRFFCLECMGGYDEYKDRAGKVVEGYMPMNDVKTCTDTTCQLYPYRFGKDPSRSREATPEVLARLDAAREKAAKNRETPTDTREGVRARS